MWAPRISSAPQTLTELARSDHARQRAPPTTPCAKGERAYGPESRWALLFGRHTLNAYTGKNHQGM
eukprot:5484859-Alexandrium_andersonii.AAC.1